jgi:hypothetical protein
MTLNLCKNLNYGSAFTTARDSYPWISMDNTDWIRIGLDMD